jgi:hypothetical protein
VGPPIINGAGVIMLQVAASKHQALVTVANGYKIVILRAFMPNTVVGVMVGNDLTIKHQVYILATLGTLVAIALTHGIAARPCA